MCQGIKLDILQRMSNSLRPIHNHLKLSNPILFLCCELDTDYGIIGNNSAKITNMPFLRMTFIKTGTSNKFVSCASHDQVIFIGRVIIL